jgi:hypothetical protein
MYWKARGTHSKEPLKNNRNIKSAWQGEVHNVSTTMHNKEVSNNTKNTQGGVEKTLKMHSKSYQKAIRAHNK